MANKPIMSVLTFLFVETVVIATLNFSFCNGSSYAGCIANERQALLKLKQDLTDPSNRLASWIGDGDCCGWTGVVCSNLSGHVLDLHLGNPLNRPTDYASRTEIDAYERSKLSGKINPSLLDFKHLIYLDLSGNNFEGVQIPEFIGSMRNLRHLDFSGAGFVGMIPSQLGNLSSLQYLDLSHGSWDLFVENLMWLSGLSLLEHLDLSGVNLINASDWLLVTNALPSLAVLQLSSCRLLHFLALPPLNFSSLAALDLSNNLFDNSLIPSWIWGLNHLVFLDLSYNHWQGPFPNGLRNMTSLRHLDLQDNYFMFPIPDWLSRLSCLEYLDLSSQSLGGLIPYQLGNLSNLQYLSLDQTDRGMLYVENLWWLSGLPLLKQLNLRGVDLSKASDHWLTVMNSLSSLTVIQLSMCQLSHFPPLPNANFSSLNTLDLSDNQFNNLQILDGLQNLTSLRSLVLSGNHFNSSIPSWIYRCSHLEDLSLSRSSLQGTISSALGNLTSIRKLDLSDNELEGRIPKSLGGLCNLKLLDLSCAKLGQEISEIIDILSGCIADRLTGLLLVGSQLSGQLTNQLSRFKNLHSLYLINNSISGPIPSSLGELIHLSYLDLSFNKLEGTLTHIHFANLTRLASFSVSRNSLKLKVNLDWAPPFQLLRLELGSCLIGPQFPSWLYSQKQLHYLDLSNSGIVDTISERFWEFLSQIDVINLSGNQIHGNIPNLTSEVLVSLDLSSNNFSGPLPIISFIIIEIDLSNNTFNGSVAHFLCHQMNETKRTKILNLGDNALSGELPDCWMNWHLSVLNMGNNKFTGKLPTSMGTITSLMSLNLDKNSLLGEIPMSLGNCTKLTAISMAENEFVGNIPTWIGAKFSALKILNFRSNNIHGHFPKELCGLASLQILDLSDNNLSGIIPKCIKNFSAMVTVNYSAMNYITYPSYITRKFVEDASLVMKGKDMDYNTILNLLRFIDLSKNNFSGAIPVEVTNLAALQSLNLSHNSLTESLPMSIGVMRSLESIDFSGNQLSGKIPESISNLTFLNYLNLSNNKLVGKIPLSTQIQGFDASCFTGNELCGSPLPKNCMTTPTPDLGDGEGHKNEVNWLHLNMGLGFAVGFWGLVGPLLFNRRWRGIYYRFLDRLGDKFFHLVRN